MKIIGITPRNPFTGETPEQMYLRKVGELGHNIIIVDNIKEIPSYANDSDVVVAMSEVSCEEAYNYSVKYNMAFYAHIEWIPRWRVFLDHEQNWGELGNISYREKINWIRQYTKYVYYWSKANVRSLAADCFHDDMKKFLGYNLKIESKRLGIDSEKIKKFKDKTEDIKKVDEITCVARFVPHKRIHHVIHALNMIDYKGILNIVGYGQEKELYTLLADNLKVNIKFHDSKDKFYCLGRSKLSVALWSGMLPAEAAYFGTPTISYESDYMKELYGNTIIYANNNDIKDLGIKIKTMLDYEEEVRKEMSLYLLDNINTKSINTYTQDEAVKMLERFIKEAINEKITWSPD